MPAKQASTIADVGQTLDVADPHSGEFRSLGGAALDRLFSIGRPLLESASAGARLYACFSEAKLFLDTITITELLAAIIRDRTARRSLAQIVSHLEHVGLILPEDVEGELGWAATRAGFPSGHAKVASVVVARELGELVGGRSVPTTMFKAYGRGPQDHSVCVEAFIPHMVETEVVDGWIARGVGVHVSIKTKTVGALAVARAIFEAEGYVMPAFMQGKPMTNPAEDVTVMYFDRLHHGRRLRIECSWSPEPIW